MTDTSTDVIDNGSDNGQSDDITTGLDVEDNQQTSQQESVTELATVVTIIIQEDFLWNLCDNSGKLIFSRTFHMVVQGIDGSTTRVLFYLPVINSLSSTLWNGISLMCIPVTHCAARI